MFKELFSCSRSEIDAAFKAAHLIGRTNGIKLLQASRSPSLPGKLLIVTPKSCGKAHKRNLLRRRLKAIFYEEKLYKKPAFSIALIYLEAMKLSFDELKSFMLKQFPRE